MKPIGVMPIPKDAQKRRSIAPVICYPTETLLKHDAAFYELAQKGMTLINSVIVLPRDGKTVEVAAGHIF